MADNEHLRVKPDHKVGELLLGLDGDADAAVHLLPVLRCRPVLDTPEYDHVVLQAVDLRLTSRG